MGRTKRDVRIGVPHHVVQRGNHQEDLFHSEGDRELYLAIINRFARLCGVEIAGFCVMTNHVHFVMVPTSLRGISDCLGRAHRKYSEYLNIRSGRFGSNWEGRFYSEPMSEAHAVHALRYIERNPVAAGIVRSATEWRWSSAGLHCGKGCLWELVTADVRPSEFRSPDIWSSFLERDLDHNERSMVGWINRTEVMNAALDGPFR